MLNKVERCFVYATMGSLLFGTGAMIVEVIARRCKLSFVPLDEIGGICMLVSAFGASSYAFRQGRFIRVRLLLERFPIKLQSTLNVLHAFFALAFLSYASYLWLKLIALNIKLKTYTASLKVPYWLLQTFTLICWVLLLIAVCEFVWKELREKTEGQEKK